MHRVVALAIVSVVLIATRAGGQPMSPATQPIEVTSPLAAEAKRAMETTIRRFWDDFARRVTTEHTRYIQRLEELMTAATRRGSLEAALSIREELAAQKQRTIADLLSAHLPAAAPVEPTANAPTSQPSGVYRIFWADRLDEATEYAFTDGQCRTRNVTTAATAQDGYVMVRWPRGFTNKFYIIGDVIFSEAWSPNVPLDQPPTRFGRGQKL